MRVSAKGFTAAIAAMTMTVVPTAAMAAPGAAASLATSSASVRAGTPVQGASKLRGDNSVIINIGILAALVVIVLVATKGSNNDSPDSP